MRTSCVSWWQFMHEEDQISMFYGSSLEGAMCWSWRQRLVFLWTRAEVFVLHCKYKSAILNCWSLSRGQVWTFIALLLEQASLCPSSNTIYGFNKSLFKSPCQPCGQSDWIVSGLALLWSAANAGCGNWNRNSCRLKSELAKQTAT